jgi:hypothetical protein
MDFAIINNSLMNITMEQTTNIYSNQTLPDLINNTLFNVSTTMKSDSLIYASKSTTVGLNVIFLFLIKL